METDFDVITEKKGIFSLFTLKIIGFFCLVISTVAWSGLVRQELLRFILGFLGAPSILIFLFAMNEALKKTSSVNKYMLRVLALAVISAFPYFMIYRDLTSEKISFSNYLSAPFTVFYSIGIIYSCDKIKSKGLKTFMLLLFIGMAMFIGVEWAPVSLIFAIIIHNYDAPPLQKFRDFNIYLLSGAILIIGGFLYLSTEAFRTSDDLFRIITTSGAMLGVPLIKNYNGEYSRKEGKFAKFAMKFGFYFAYPTMLIVIAVIKYFVINSAE